MAKDIVKAIPITGKDAATIGPAFALITDPTGIPEPCFYIKIVNDSNIFISVSYDGVTHHDYIPAHEEMTVYAQTNNQPGNHRAYFPKGQLIYVGSNGAGIGSVNLIGYYNPR